MLVLVLGLAASARAEDLKPTDVSRWDGFPGPTVQPTLREGEAFVTIPISSGPWKESGQLSFWLAPVVAAKPDSLVVQGRFHRFEVPGAFVAPAAKPAKIAKGSYVQFAVAATPTMAVNIGRVKKIAKDGTLSIDYLVVDDLHTVEVPPSRVRPLDGTLAWGQPISFPIDGQRALGWYIAPGRDDQHVWALNTGLAYELEGATPLAIKEFSRGAKVLAVVRTTSVFRDGKDQPPRQYLEPAVIVGVRDGGLTYKIKSAKGESMDRSVDLVFAR